MVFNESAVEPCLTEADMACMGKEYEEIFSVHDQPQETTCPVSCVTRRNDVMIREDATKDMGNFTSIYVFYRSSTVTVVEEYRLFDFNAIVAAVGGSLGLFLGFSCWQFVLSTAEVLEHVKRKGKVILV